MIPQPIGMMPIANGHAKEGSRSIFLVFLMKVIPYEI